MKKIILMVLALNAMQVIYAQDSLSIKMNQIDEYRESLMNKRDGFLCVKFPLNMYNVNENSCYIDYEKPDTIYYYFQDFSLVLIEHCTDRLVDDNCDTDNRRLFEFNRFFFQHGKLCLEESFRNTFIQGNRGLYCSIEESRTYWDIAIDKKLVNKNRGTMPNSPVLEAKVDSVMNVTEWEYYQIDKTTYDYKYGSGKRYTEVHCLYTIKENGFIFPDGVKMPYSE